MQGGKSVADCIPTPSGQNPGTTYDFGSFCDAFKSLGQYPKGCPSPANIPPIGNVAVVDAANFNPDGKTSTALSIKTDGINAYWVFKGGYIRDETYMGARESEKCGEICKNDSNCAATFFTSDTTIGSQGGFCFRLYSSDTLIKANDNYEHLCGVDIPHMKAAEVCKSSLGVVIWWARKP
ncbi:MAG: hypothetical protein KAH18_08185 [Psychromonas sp.]|nr:hypothetical protein [Psychromonas sp.]